MGTTNDPTKDESLKPKSVAEFRKTSGTMSTLMPMKALHKVSNSRTQLFLLFIIIFYMTMHLELFKHATSSVVTDTRM